MHRFREPAIKQMNGRTGFRLSEWHRSVPPDPSVQINDFCQSADERSWQIRHDYSFAIFGASLAEPDDRLHARRHKSTTGRRTRQRVGNATLSGLYIQRGPLRICPPALRNATYRKQLLPVTMDENA